MILDWKDTLLNLIENYTRNTIHTALPGVVLDVKEYQGKMCVDVSVSISRLYKTGDVLPNKDCVIWGVPVVMPSGGGGMISFPIKKGDSVLLIFSMRNIDSWRASDGKTDVIPDDSRHYSEDDAIAIPGLFTEKNHLSPHPDNVEIKFNDILFSLKPNGDIIIKNSNSTIELTSSGITATAPSINLNGVTIDSQGNVSAPGSIEGNEITDTATNNTLSTHKHSLSGSAPIPGT